MLIVRNLPMIMFSFAGFLRVDELSFLCFNDVSVKKISLGYLIRESKTDQYRQGIEILISKGNPAACPVNMYQRYPDLLEDVGGTFFIFR